ncbi:GPP34 family phosphoprotein [Streptomyces tropicalis]|uniref:GPP34 family phosphoprotein n=1 Tax=Streptomyces tropicalis TaxID=3034234 RepID=A0ABT6AAV2_9ACTN|nr:GPP34 family phosphoprotein [Streptomyces tropicalis]MDF3301787.1 GPP34 family phosphoprotein [Streptomyces tropicalis]
MSTARDLMIVTLDAGEEQPVQQGELSLALAGAETVDLLAAEALGLEGDRVVPRLTPRPDDRLLDEAAASLVRGTPYETLEDWLWRRGRGLSTAYLAALEEEGLITWRRSHWMPFRGVRAVLADTDARRRSAARWAAGEPVLATLAGAVGVRAPDAVPDPADDTVLTVLAAVHDALMELEAVRQRRAIEDAAFANVWRGA